MAMIITYKHDEFLEFMKQHFTSGVLLLLLWDRSGGCTDYVYLDKYSNLEQLCRALPSATNVIFFERRVEPRIHLKSKVESAGGELLKKFRSLLLVENEATEWSQVSSRLILPRNSICEYEYELAEELAECKDSKEFLLFPDPPSIEQDTHFQTFIGNVPGVY